MAKKDVQDYPYQKLGQLLGVIPHEDERGLILSLSSFAEESLRRLLMVYMRDVKSSAKLIEDFGAPLGTFSAKIAAAYALGLISDTQYADLEQLRNIRNQFAHTWTGVSFKTDSVRKRIDNLSEPRHGVPDSQFDPQFDKVRRTFSGTIAEMELLAERIKTLDLRLKPIAAHAVELTKQNKNRT
ncbi:MltR family transcriptional regulator [Rhizobium leguminosarum]|uniref:MltR family transcriptional regulator n=1 Tax=Rhizobium leguminosarum TaxID=384 RepID=UPI001C97DD8F|nr:MltR family transcriptional regulator [Rhizobium leguminosarum]